VGLALLATPAVANERKALKALEQFDIALEPSPADWRFFLKSPEGARAQLWQYHQKRGKGLGHWAWGWRLGWVRVCGTSTAAYCGAVLRDALFDKALVVRAEAATRVGRRFAGKADAGAVKLLAEAYKNPKNLRGGRPLFVQNRILFALKQIGGAAALAEGEALSGQHAAMKTYWAALARAEG